MISYNVSHQNKNIVNFAVHIIMYNRCVECAQWLASTNTTYS